MDTNDEVTESIKAIGTDIPEVESPLQEKKVLTEPKDTPEIKYVIPEPTAEFDGTSFELLGFNPVNDEEGVCQVLPILKTTDMEEAKAFLKLYKKMLKDC